MIKGSTDGDGCGNENVPVTVNRKAKEIPPDDRCQYACIMNFPTARALARQLAVGSLHTERMIPSWRNGIVHAALGQVVQWG